MKKTLLLPLLFLSSFLHAHYYNYELTPLVGYNITEGNLNINNYINYGAELQFNNYSPSIKPEVSFLYGDGTYNAPFAIYKKTTDIFRFALNGVYDFYQGKNSFTPFVKFGLGYEQLGSKYSSGNYSDFYLDTGVGAKLALTPYIALKAQAIYMLKQNQGRYDNNLNLLLGITFSFDRRVFSRRLLLEEVQEKVVVEEPKDDDHDGVINDKDDCPNTPYGRDVNKHGCEKDSDHDGIVNSKDLCPDTPYGEEVDYQGCALDSDQDGVIDSQDMCPDSPEGVEVDEKGCELDSDGDGVVDSLDMCPDTPVEVHQVDENGCFKELNLHINFETGSARVQKESLQKIKEFATFLHNAPLYTVTIEGHTDSVGTQQNNLRLSQKRAERVRELLIENGVDPETITAVGKGESQPIASNETAEGRAQNRRIEAHLQRK